MATSDESLEAFFTLEQGGRALEDAPVFRVLILGDWSGSSRSGSIASRTPVFIDRDDFDDVMKRYAPTADVPIGDGDHDFVTVGFESIEDFRPENLLEKLPVFGDLRDIRKRLCSQETFESAAGDLRGFLSTGVVGTGVSNDSPVSAVDASDILTDILESSGTSRQPSTDPLKQFIGEIVSPHLIRIDLAEQKELISAVDEAISALMRKILHSPSFQELEAAWRGLHLLVRKTETGTELKIYVANLSKSELTDDVKECGNLADSAAFRLLAGGAGESWALVCGNYDFDTDVSDTASLIRISSIAASTSTPFITHFDAEVIAAFSEDGDLITKAGFFGDEKAEKLFSALRTSEGASSLGLLTPKILGRMPYGERCDVVDGFAFEEFDSLPDHEKYLWVNPCFIFAKVVCRAFTSEGWSLYGSVRGDVENLPMHVYKNGGATTTKPCAEFLMTEVASEQLLEMGIMPVVSFKETDRVKIVDIQSVAVGRIRLNARWNQ